MPRVLLVEDDADTRGLLRRRIERAGHSVDEAESGERALAALADSDYDLVILDVRLPGIQGWDVMRAMALDDRLSSVPILMCSITEPEDAPDGLEAVGWLAKPFTRHDLGVALSAALQGPD